MKIRAFLLLSVALALASAASLRAETAAKSAPASERQLTIMIVDSLQGNPSGMDMFDRLARVFTDVFEARKWPLKIDAERFGAGGKTPEIELRLYYLGIKHFDPMSLRFRVWVVLTVGGTKHDLGITYFDYYPRALEPMDDQLDKVIGGGARLVADKIDPILFPKATPSK